MPKNNKKARMASTFEKKRKDQISTLTTHATRVLFLSIYQKRGCRGSPLKLPPTSSEVTKRPCLHMCEAHEED
jgi:hypothetical protein